MRLLEAHGLPTEPEPWSKPLIGLTPHGVQLKSLVGKTPQEDEPITSAVTSIDLPLRCVLATGGLERGGLGEVVAYLATRLPGEGIETLVLDCGGRLSTDVRGATLRRTLESAGVVVIEAHSSSDLASLLPWNPDVINSHGAPPWVLSFATRGSIAYVETLHGMHDFIGADWQVEAAHADQVALFVAVSELVRQQYLQGNPSLPASRIVTIPNVFDVRDRASSVDRDRARAALGLDREFVFLSLSRYCLQKNVVGLVAAFAGVARNHPDAHLLVSGYSEDRFHFTQAYMKSVDDGSASQIHLREHTTVPAVLLAAADAFVLDSFFEGWALASMEALGAGLPVILSEVGGAAEQVGSDGQRGVLVPNPLGHTHLVDWATMRDAAYAPQPNAAELEDGMHTILGQRDRWRDQRDGLRENFNTLFRPEDCIGAHAGAIREALVLGSVGRRPPPTP